MPLEVLDGGSVSYYGHDGIAIQLLMVVVHGTAARSLSFLAVWVSWKLGWVGFVVSWRFEADHAGLWRSTGSNKSQLDRGMSCCYRRHAEECQQLDSSLLHSLASG